MKSKINTKKYYIQGMHCMSCELIIKERLENIENITNASANLKTHILEISIKKDTEFPSSNQINELFKDLGYTFYENKPSSNNIPKYETEITIILIALLVSLFIIIENTGFFFKYSLTAQSSYISYFIFGFVAGLSSCAALVGGLLLSMSDKWNHVYNKNRKKSHIPFVMFNTGRLISFAFLGGILGLLGSLFSISFTFTIILTILVCLIMIILGAQMMGMKIASKIRIKTPAYVMKHIKNESDLSGKYVPFIVGALTFFIPCGFTLIAQSNVLLTGSFITGSILMFSFALGTLPILVFISFTSLKFHSSIKFNRIFNKVAGIIVIIFGLYTLNAQLNILGLSQLITDYYISDDITHEIDAEFVDNTQILKLTAKEFEYRPLMVNLKSNITTKLIIDNQGAVGCAQAVYARGLYDNVILLEPGINEIDIPDPIPGKYLISCSMGMVEPVVVNVFQ